MYDKGDGDDVIYGYRNTENYVKSPYGEDTRPKDAIKLKSGILKRSSLNGSDVVLTMSDGSITLKDAKNSLVKVITAEGGAITIDPSKNNYIATPKKRTVGRSETITAEYEAGEVITGSDGSSVTIESGDSLMTDREGNISVIKISDKRHQISTDIKSGSSVKVKYAESDIANVMNGLVNVYWNDDGRIVIEAADKNKLINVEALSDSVNIIGSNKSDIIISKGKSASIVSNSGNDIVSNNGLNSTIVSGSDNDTINGNNIGIIQLSSGTLKKATTKNSDVLITISNDKVITIKNAAGEEVFNDYIEKLKKLHENVWWNVIIGMIKDGGGSANLIKYVNYAKSIVTTIITGTEDDVINEMKKIVKKEFSTWIANKGPEWIKDFLIEYIPDGKGQNIVDAAEAFGKLKGNFEEIQEKYEALVAQIEAAKSGDVGASYSQFKNAYDAFAELEEDVDNAINGTSFIDDVKNNIEDFIDSVIKTLDINSTVSAGAAASSLRAGEPIYISRTGEISNSSNDAAISIKESSSLISYELMTKESQELKIGSAEDNVDWHIKMSSGNDTITAASAADVTIDSGAGSDKITSNGTGKTVIKSGAGKDFIENKSSNVVINGEADNDTIWSRNGSNSNITMNGGAGNDRLELWATKSIIDGGDGNDLIYTHAKNATITSGAGNDTIENWDDNKGWLNGSLVGGAGKNKIITGAGNDSIKNFGQNTTINAGTGNDTINLVTSSKYSYSKNNYIQYASGDGNDIVTGYSSTDTIHITRGTYSTQNSGNDVIVKVGSGSIRLKNAKGTKLNIKGNAPTPKTLTVTNSTKSPVTAASNIQVIDASKRTIAAKITGNSLANTIKGGSAVDTIYGGVGNDSILGNAGNDKLFGDTGNDTLNGGIGNDTLNGGAGNDILTGGSGGGDVFTYKTGDGNDIITDYTAGQDKIKITSGAITASSASGRDVILQVGKGSIKVTNGVGKKISVVEASGKINNIFIGGGGLLTSLSVTDSNSSQFTVPNGILTVDASKRTKAIKITGNSLSNSIIDGKAADTLTGGKGNDTLTGGAGADVLTGFGTLGLFNTPKGTGLDIYFDSSNSRVDNWASNVNIYNNYENNFIGNDGGSNVNIYSYNGGDITSQGGKNVVINAVGDLPYEILNIIGGLSGVEKPYNVKITAGNGNDNLRNEGDRVWIDTGDGDDVLVNDIGKNVTIYSGKGRDYLHIEGGSFITLDAGVDSDSVDNYATNVSINAGEGDDNLHTANGSKYVTINAGIGNDTVYVEEGSSFVTVDTGVDSDFVNNWGDNVSINTGDDNDDIFNLSGKYITINSGNGSDYICIEDGSFITVNAGTDTSSDHVENHGGSNVSISTDKGDDIIENYGSQVTIDSGSGNNYIKNGRFSGQSSNPPSNVKISTEQGNDLIENYGNDAIINTKGGNDYIYSSGNKVIINAGGENCE